MQKSLALVVAYAEKGEDALQSVLSFTYFPGNIVATVERNPLRGSRSFYEESGIGPSWCTAAITDGGGPEKPVQT